jgi:ElaB/YqjD/DUF883 family membrane-anchored ribosome-binding protein
MTTIGDSTDKLLDDVREVVRDAEALLQATAAQGGDRIDAVRTRAMDSLQKARKRLAAIEKGAVEEVREAAETADEYVRKNPWQAVGVAAGLGVLLGLLIGRR